MGLAAVVAFAVLGGTSFAGEAAKKPKPAKAQYGQYNNASKVTLCHKGKVTIRVGAPAVKAHEAHGDTVGACATTSAAAAAKAKAKKAKKSEDATEDATSAGSSSGQGKAKGKNK